MCSPICRPDSGILHDRRTVVEVKNLSILFGLVSASGTMTDTNISYERNKMNVQIRGPGSHPVWGFLPSSGTGLVFMHIGFFTFHFFYLGSGVLALSGAFICFEFQKIVALYLTEFVVILAVMFWKNGHLHTFPSKKLNHSVVDVISWFVMGPIMQSFIPFFAGRGPTVFGGGFFLSMIMYRLTTNYLFFSEAAEQFNEMDEVFMKAEDAKNLMNICVVGTIVGYSIIIASARKSHRYQLKKPSRVAKSITNATSQMSS